MDAFVGNSTCLVKFENSKILIIITQRFYRQLITSLKVIANFSDMSNLREDDAVSGAADC